MPRLSRNLQISAIVAALSIGLLFLIPKEVHGTRLFGFSATRLGMLSILVLFLGFLVWAIIWLHKHPDREQSIQQNLQSLISKSWIGKAIQFSAALVIILIVNFSIGILFFNNAQYRGIYLRLFPVFLLLFCVAVQILLFEGLRGAGGRWAWTLLCAIICTIGGILIQKILIDQLNHPFKSGFLFFYGIWLLTFFANLILVSMLVRLPKTELAVWRMVVVLAGVLFLFQWYLTPNRDWSTQLTLSLYGVLLVVGAVILTKLAHDLVAFLVARYPQKISTYLLVGMGVTLAILAILFYNGAALHARTVNTDLTESDQNAYINFAKDARRLGFQYAGDFNRMPLYPFLLALTYRPEMSDQEFFAQSKQMNIVVSLVLLSALFVVLARSFSIYQSFLLTMISAFSVFIFLAGYAKVELIYYFIGLLAFMGMLQMIRKPGLILGIATGVALGLAYLSKASALLGLYIFVVVYLFMVGSSILKLFREKPVTNQKFLLPLKSVAYLFVTLLVFFTVTYPYIRVAKQRFGHYFYNVNSTFYLWYDSFEAAKQANLEYGFSKKWPDQLTQDEIPSLQKYLREHSMEQIVARIQFGIETQVHNLSRQYSFTNFMLSYGIIFLLAVLVDVKQAFSLAKRSVYVVGFSVIYILVHIASFVWYSSIAIGPRFTLGIFLPIMFSLFAGIKYLAENQEIGLVEQGVQPSLSEFSLAANVLMTIILVVNIWLVLSGGIISGHFGS